MNPETTAGGGENNPPRIRILNGGKLIMATCPPDGRAEAEEAPVGTIWVEVDEWPRE